MRLIFIPFAVAIAFASLGFEILGWYKCAYWLNELGIWLEKW